ncbi:hypothetical protein OH76DRAFT_639725 [Lentinus brumalis]|uniref:Uncharacterized protein n=1 Tax=Lentinus brumalis TaxID=2498619 RepID=A0A371D7R3_9APHY|nr:hypothetical protein OH76DRAFT_639725 [Polyporus brumalis]
MGYACDTCHARPVVSSICALLFPVVQTVINSLGLPVHYSNAKQTFAIASAAVTVLVKVLSMIIPLNPVHANILLMEKDIDIQISVPT